MMANTAEESLMALLEAMLTLAANEVLRPKPPLVKAGGYSEDCFVDLTEEEKENFSCNICYQILKETRQCINSHKFCSTCLQVWCSTGQYENRNGCPLCRTHGGYLRNQEIDEYLGAKKVKCLLESCKWSGLLKHLCSHRHTTYGNSSTSENDNTETMPRLIQVTPHVPHRSHSRFTGTGLITQNSSQSANSPAPPSRLSRLGHVSESRTSLSSVSSAGEETITELPWRVRPASNRLSSFRMPGIRASSRITFNHTRPGTDNNNNIDNQGSILSLPVSTNGDSTETVPNSVSGSLTPRPPAMPRTSSNIVNTRRLPRINNAPPPAQNNHYHPPGALVVQLNSEPRPRAQENLGEIRDRLHESRSRLDNLMVSFSGEVNRSRQAMAEFQQERDRHRQEQLDEVRELGQRLGQVASELRRLLEQRRHVYNFSDDEDCD